jgi:SAM-dependent methyltransferase
MPVVYVDNKDKLPKRSPDDFYETPELLVKAMFSLVHTSHTHILDPGCGRGVFAQYGKDICQHATFEGVEINPEHANISKPFYSEVYQQDFRTFTTDKRYDLIIGNPPYKYAEEFIRKSYSLLKKGGDLVFLLRGSFLESRRRGKGLFKEMRPLSVNVLVQRPSFTGDNRTDPSSYIVVRWVNEPVYTTFLEWLDWR